MPKNSVRVNQLIEVVVPEGESGRTYRSRVEEIIEDTLLIAMPMYRNVPVLLDPGTDLLIRFVSEGGVYQFQSFFQEKTFQPIPLWTIGPIVDYKKIQRRAFYRIESHLPAILSIGGEREFRSEVDSTTLLISTKDLSAGGARVISKERFALGSEVYLELELPGKDPVRSMGRVVRLETAAPDSSIFWVSIQFTSIEEQDRKKIVRFVFQKQLDHR